MKAKYIICRELTSSVDEYWDHRKKEWVASVDAWHRVDNWTSYFGFPSESAARQEILIQHMKKVDVMVLQPPNLGTE